MYCGLCRLTRGCGNHPRHGALRTVPRNSNRGRGRRQASRQHHHPRLHRHRRLRHCCRHHLHRLPQVQQSQVEEAAAGGEAHSHAVHVDERVEYGGRGATAGGAGQPGPGAQPEGLGPALHVQPEDGAESGPRWSPLPAGY